MAIFVFMIKAIIFDIGGVLIDLDKRRCIEAFHSLGISEIDELLDDCHQKGIFLDMETGRLSEAGFYDECRKLSKLKITDNEIKNAFLSFCIGIKAEKLLYLKELSDKYDLYFLSNNNPIVMREFNLDLQNYGLDIETSFKDRFISYELGIAKPNIEIFRIADTRIGRPAEEILYIDDSENNVKAAEKMCWNTLLYQIGTDLKDATEQKLNSLKK